MSSVERLLADGYWKDGVFTRFAEVDLKAIEEAFAERVLAQLHKRELISDDDVASTSSAQQRRYSLRITLALASGFGREPSAGAQSNAQPNGFGREPSAGAQSNAQPNGWVTPSTTKRASSSSPATSNALPSPLKNSPSKMT